MRLVTTIVLLALEGTSFGFGPFSNGRTPYPQELVDHKNVLKYHGGNGPYVDRRSYGINRDPPLGCEVKQVVMLGRHGERWPENHKFKHMLKSVDKLRALKGNLKGSLEFANSWKMIAEPDSPWLGQESLTGVYSGLLHGYELGIEARRRYFHLYNATSPIPIFAAGFERIVDTARKFGEGFLGWNYTDLAAINIIQETSDQGANTLTPTCKLKDERPLTNCRVPHSSFEFPEYMRAADRLNTESPGLNLAPSDIRSLISLAFFELNTRGSSPWIDVFTAEEFSTFEYDSSSHWYCYTGPGSITGAAEGSLFVNATRQLLLEGPERSLPLTFAFAHDTNIVQAVTALGIDVSDLEWDLSQVQFGQRWDVSDIVPQGASLVLESLQCSASVDRDSGYQNRFPAAFPHASDTTSNSTSADGVEARRFIRVVLNDAVVPLSGCTNGPGFSCELAEYDAYVDRHLRNYVDECDIPEGSPEHLTFFWDYNLTSTYNSQPAVLPYQAEGLSWDDTPINLGM